MDTNANLLTEEKDRNMKIVVDGKIINIDDIKDAHCTNPHEYHIDMSPFLIITLKTDEKIFTNNKVNILK